MKHDSRELTSANSALTDSISRERGLEKFKEIPHACPNELFRRRIEELDSELKKFDEHVIGGAQAVIKNSTIPHPKELIEFKQKQVLRRQQAYPRLPKKV